MEYYRANPRLIEYLLKKITNVTKKEIENIVEKAFKFNEISLEEVAILISSIKNNSSYKYIIQAGNEMRKKIYANYVKIYVPLYITSECANNCIYCGFRRDNNHLKRNTLKIPEFLKELEKLLNIGHRNIEIVLGYHPMLTKGSILAEYVKQLREKLNKLGKGSIILMSEPMDVDDYKKLKGAGLNEIYTWQETYNENQYYKVHPENTHKSLYEWRLQVFDRAIKAGIKKIGMGVLFGLYRWEYDELSLIHHALWIKKNYGIEPYAFGVPRFKKAPGALKQRPFFKVSNKMYTLSVAIRRLIFPFTHTYMNTRENLNFILKLLNSGGTEINTEASTVPGGYTGIFSNGKQFFHYSYNSRNVFKILKKHGFMPIFKDVRPLINVRHFKRKIHARRYNPSLTRLVKQKARNSQ